MEMSYQHSVGSGYLSTMGGAGATLTHTQGQRDSNLSPTAWCSGLTWYSTVLVEEEEEVQLALSCKCCSLNVGEGNLCPLDLLCQS